MPVKLISGSGCSILIVYSAQRQKLELQQYVRDLLLSSPIPSFKLSTNHLRIRKIKPSLVERLRCNNVQLEAWSQTGSDGYYLWNTYHPSYCTRLRLSVTIEHPDYLTSGAENNDCRERKIFAQLWFRMCKMKVSSPCKLLVDTTWRCCCIAACKGSLCSTIIPQEVAENCPSI